MQNTIGMIIYNIVYTIIIIIGQLLIARWNEIPLNRILYRNTVHISKIPLPLIYKNISILRINKLCYALISSSLVLTIKQPEILTMIFKNPDIRSLLKFGQEMTLRRPACTGRCPRSRPRITVKGPTTKCALDCSPYTHGKTYSTCVRRGET